LKADGSYRLVELRDQLPYPSAGLWQVQGGKLILLAEVTDQPPTAKLERSARELPRLASKDFAAEVQVHSGGTNALPAVSTAMTALKDQTGLMVVRVADPVNHYVYSGIRVSLTFTNTRTFAARDVRQTVTDGLGRFYYQLAPGQQIKSISLGVNGDSNMSTPSPSRVCLLAGGRLGAVALGGDPKTNLGAFVVNPSMRFFDFSFSPNRMDTGPARPQTFALQNGELLSQTGIDPFAQSWLFSKSAGAVPACLS
jgi:hypothetical protein